MNFICRHCKGYVYFNEQLSLGTTEIYCGHCAHKSEIILKDVFCDSDSPCGGRQK